MSIVTDNDTKLLKKFEKIDKEWRDRTGAMDSNALKATLVEVTRNEGANQEQKEQDEDLARSKAQYDDAAAGYKEATAMNKLKVKFLLRQLKSKPQ